MLGLENILLSITAFCNVGLALFVYSKSKENRVNFFFALFSIFLVFWALFLIGYRLVDNHLTAIYLLKASYISALIIGISFFSFSILFTENLKRLTWIQQILIVIPSLVFFILLLLIPDFLTKGIVEHPWGKETLLGVKEYVFFVALFSFFFVGGLLKIWSAFFRASGMYRHRLLAIGASVTLAGILGMYFNLILPSPFFQDFRYIWTGPLFTFVIAVVITYSIFRLKLFNPQAIAAELFTFTLWIFILVRFLLSADVTEQIINGVMLFVSVVIGILLIRSVTNEFEAREKIEKLAENLEDANARLRELDRQKSEFLSMAAHQLRTPLTSIKGYASLMLEGSYGELPQKVNTVLETIFSSSARMVDTVSDFLNVSRIEQGKMEYRMEHSDLGGMAKSVVTELALSANEKKLDLKYHDDGNGPYPIYADTSKLEHVISNIVDNAIKYTPKGSVTVRVEKDIARNIGRVKVLDTGAGIPADALPKLFDKFVRARNANEINVTGTGLGLYVAREMIEKHNGKIWAESKGENRGSTFVVEIPLSDPRINSAQT